uniref:Alpha-(1,6)-fucosyltransferase n=1 Tax=Sipha flava TaxID=143950 RepID=A0A2S2Q3C9_9HEMI
MRINKRLRTFIVLMIFLWVIYMLSPDFNHNDEVYLNKKLHEAINELKKLHVENKNLKLKVTSLHKMLEKHKNKNSDANAWKGPREQYELVRRRIYANTKEIWYYISSELRSLSREVTDVDHVDRMKSMVDEHYRSLLNDEARLADVDGHSAWRHRENKYLSRLVEKRLVRSQNPPDCGNAKKLVCNFVNSHWCGYSCRLHHFIKCLIIAYGTERTLVIGNPASWEFTSGGWDTLFLPPSTCASVAANEPVLEWPGLRDVQVVNLTLPEPPYPSPRLRPRFIPVVLPEDLARRINVLHGDPAVWWIGQFFKYLLRPQPATSDAFDAYAKRVRFQKPIVGVHIRREDKIFSEAALHELDEYMYHVGEYYKIKQLNGGVDKKRIYLATDEPTLFDEAKRKYPEYDIIGDPSLSESGKFATREMNHSILNINIDIHFLSLCDYLVCTFSSNVCIRTLFINNYY